MAKLLALYRKTTVMGVAQFSLFSRFSLTPIFGLLTTIQLHLFPPVPDFLRRGSSDWLQAGFEFRLAGSAAIRSYPCIMRQFLFLGIVRIFTVRFYRSRGALNLGLSLCIIKVGPAALVIVVIPLGPQSTVCVTIHRPLFTKH